MKHLTPDSRGDRFLGYSSRHTQVLSLRLQPERFVPLYPRKLAFTINLMLKTTKKHLEFGKFSIK